MHSKRADKLKMIDPMRLAEHLTGRHRASRACRATAVVIHHDRKAQLRALRSEAADTYNDCAPRIMRSVLKELGAVRLLARVYTSQRHFEVWAHEMEGWIVTFKTIESAIHGGQIVESAALDLNIAQPGDMESSNTDRIGGGFVRLGDHMQVQAVSYLADDGLKSRIERLRAGTGELLREWVDGNGTLFHMAPPAYEGDFTEACQAIAGELPAWVQANLASNNSVPLSQLRSIGR